ncbi:GSCOCT00014337001.2-RA-CDS [Cotesia congregata]|uniref:Cc_single_21.2 n=1 Tax=Cotesia congregata TaxID=51543 RepID=S6CVX1_COTCN|nr:GSCOCT00014337001.2-RA-CDS [Cotesia congregata]CAG5074169.1 cc_single_21.2 [Cotesia congregata]CCQ71391.1 hypothetical protein CcBV_21.2 [Cotesia congregata]
MFAKLLVFVLAMHMVMCTHMSITKHREPQMTQPTNASCMNQALSMPYLLMIEMGVLSAIILASRIR